MSTAAVRVGAVAGVSRDDRIEINGHDITSAVRRMTLDAEAGRLTSLTLNLNAVKGATLDGEMDVRLDEDVRDALLAIGWSAPPDERLVRFWLQVSLKELVDRLRENPVAGVTFLRAVDVSSMFRIHETWLVELADVNAPAAAEGRLLAVTFQDHYDDDHQLSATTISDYGIPADAA